jgi:hypothetical protein
MVHPLSSVPGLRLEYLNVVVCGLLIGCLLRAKLVKTYAFFLAYLVTYEVAIIVDVAWWGALWNKQVFFISARFLMLILIMFTVREVLRVVLSNYPGLAEFLKKNQLGLVGTSIFVALLLAPLDPALPWTHIHLFQHSYTVERTVYSGLLSYLLMVSFLIAWARVRVGPTVAFYVGGLVAFLASNWAVLLLRNLTFRSMGWLNATTLVVSLVFLVCWIVAINARRETLTHPTDRIWNPVLFDQLWRQLESINANLVRFGRPNYE